MQRATFLTPLVLVLLVTAVHAQEQSSPAPGLAERHAAASARVEGLRESLESAQAALKARAGEARKRQDAVGARLAAAKGTPAESGLASTVELHEQLGRVLQASSRALDEELSAAQKLVASLAEGLRAESEGPKGMTVPSDSAQARRALVQLTALEARKGARQTGVESLDTVVGLQEALVAKKTEELDAAREARDAAPADGEPASRVPLAVAVEVAEAELALETLRLRRNVDEREAAVLDLAVASDRLTRRRSTLDEADPKLMSMARAAIEDEAEEQAAKDEESAERDLQREHERNQEAQKRAREALDAAVAMLDRAETATERATAQAVVENAERRQQLAEMNGVLISLRAEHAAARRLARDAEADIAAALAEAEKGRPGVAVETAVTDAKARVSAAGDLIANLEALAKDADAQAELLTTEARQLLELYERQSSGERRSAMGQRARESKDTARELSGTAENIAGLRSKMLLLATRSLERDTSFLGQDDLVRARWKNFLSDHKQFFLVLLVTLLASLLVRYILKALLFFTSKSRWAFDQLAVETMEGPVRFAVVIIGLHVAKGALTLTSAWAERLDHWSSALVLMTVTFAVYRAVDLVAHLFEGHVSETETKLDDQLLPLLKKLARIAIIAGGAVMVLEALDYKVSSIITGLGLGGLAFALAAKDTVSNLFGSIMIFTDKPFNVDDWIKFKNSEGVVEEIGLRSTKVRTWEDTLLTIPNAEIATSAVENVSRFNSRRVYVKICIRCDTPPADVKRAVEIIREVLDDHELVKDGHYVYFNELTDWGCSIMVYYFVKFTEWRVYLETRQTIFLDIMDRYSKEGIELAYPTQTLLIEGTPDAPAQP